MQQLGAILFGVVVGWTTYRTLRRQSDAVALGDIASVIGAVGGAAVTGLFADKEIFGGYCVGLFVGFFLYLVIATTVGKNIVFLGKD
jgi:hypothetical protein